MPEISEQDFAALAAQVASLSSALAVARRRIDDLEDGMTGHLGLDWGESLVDVNSPHPNISANTIESGGGIIRQDANGMQVATGGAATGTVYWVYELKSDPTDLSTGTDSYAILEGNIASGSGGAASLNYSVFSGGELGGIQVSVNGSVEVVENLLGGALLLADAVSPGQITGNQDNYAPSRYSAASVYRLSSDAARDITGLAGGNNGQIRLILNVGAFNITLKNDVTSTPANRFLFGADLVLGPDEGCAIWYDNTSSRWRRFG